MNLPSPLFRRLLVLCLALPRAGADDAPAEPILAPDDSVIFVRDGDLQVVRADGLGVRNLTNTVDRESRPVASPEGTAIAYEVYDSERGEYDIWLCTPDGGNLARLLPLARNPSWSPDGGRLVFAAQQRGQGLNLWLCNRRGEELHRLTETAENDLLPCFSPDGTEIAFVRDQATAGGRDFAVIIRDARGAEREVLRLADRRIGSLVWSPQDRLLVGAREPSSNQEHLFSLDPTSGDTTDLTRGPDDEIFGVWGFGPPGFVYVERRGNRLQISERGLSGLGRPIGGTLDGDTEPTVLPGVSRRAPHLYVFGRRSFYLPTPIPLADDVLVPAPDLSVQLGMRPEYEPNRVTLRREGKTVIIDLLSNEVTTGEQTTLLGVKCERVAEVLMLPLRRVAELFGLRAEWRPETRILRVG